MNYRPKKRILLSVPHMEGREQNYVADAFRTNWLSSVGPNLVALEKEFSEHIGLPCVALSSGTSGIHLAVRLVNVQPEDEVVVSTLTFAATSNPVLYERARPVFMDSNYDTWNLDPELLSNFLRVRAEGNRLPKAVIVVHLFGQSADMDPIIQVCAEYDIPVIEDAAEALGTTYRGRPAGSLGDISVFSFNGNKIITSSGGGMLAAREKWRVERARFWSTQARDPGVNYLHSDLGHNYRMSNVLAGIARGQLEVLEMRVAQRRAIAFRYRDGLADIPGFELMPQAPYGRHTNWLSCFLITPREFGLDQAGLISVLNAANIESRPVWKPLHTQRLYVGYESVYGDVAEDLNERGVCLPSSSSLSEEDQTYVIQTIREAHQRAVSMRRVCFSTPQKVEAASDM